MNINERRRDGDRKTLNSEWNVPAIYSIEWWLQGPWIAPFSFNWMVAVFLVSKSTAVTCVNKMHKLSLR